MQKQPPKPSEKNRLAAIDEMCRGRKAHLEAQGKQPTHREIEKYVKEQAAKADRKNGW